jgi:predicted esterase
MRAHALAAIILVLAGYSSTLAAPPRPHATGELTLNFTERSPLTPLDTLLRRLDYHDQPMPDRSVFEYDIAAEPFLVAVPTSYKPNIPHGLYVWTGVTHFSHEWLPVLARHKLIFVDGTRPGHRAVTYAKSLDAVHNLKKLYNLDESRIYASGFSAGGSQATYVLRAFPEVFRGAYLLLGGAFYSRYDDKKTGRIYATAMPSFPAWKGPLDQIKKDVKITILRGARDTIMTAQQGRSNYDALLLDGFTRVTYVEVPGLGHNHPDAPWFEKGIIAMEAKPKTPPTTSPTTKPSLIPAQIAQAQRILNTALMYHEQKPPKGRPKDIEDTMRRNSREKARTYFQRVVDEYPTTPAATRARELLKTPDYLTSPPPPH